MAHCDSEILKAELVQVQQKAPNIEGVTLEACLPALVRVHIFVSDMRQLVACLQFTQNYPIDPIVVELKSKTLSDKLLYGLVKLCDTEALKFTGQKQVIMMINFVKTFLIENPLCIVNDEIGKVKKELLSEEDDCKLKQKTSQIIYKIKQESYFMQLRITIPEDYPNKQVQLELVEQNFPELLKTNFIAQAVEIARQCVQAPIKKKPKDPPFEPKPSLFPVCKHLIQECIKRYGVETCPICNERVLPDNPDEKIVDKRKRIERVYCGHLYHYGCLYKFLKAPPFAVGKYCPRCGNQIFHEKFKISPELAEARWAHKQARQRELAEVVDFLE